MTKKVYSCSAPGSIMLMGEHAVLRNKLALAAAVNKRIKAVLIPENHHEIHIYSNLGEYHAHKEKIIDHPSFRFLIAILRFYQDKIPSGFSLKIDSEFLSTVGLGSSAAVVVAMIGCLEQWLENKMPHFSIFSKAKSIIQAVQGCGSGADVAASVFGGIVSYQMHPLSIKKSMNIFNMALIYTGYKTATPQVIEIVNKKVATNPEKYADIFNQMNQCSEAAWNAIEEKNYLQLAQIMEEHQLLQEALGVCDKKTQELRTILKNMPEVLASKISGSGLGDCVLALINTNWTWDNEEFIMIDAALSSEGIIDECT